jgi:glycosyltransferase involved in cell wall biosynthesis
MHMPKSGAETGAKSGVKSGAKPVLVVGPLPPPVHGAAVITRAVAALLATAGAHIVECNLSPRASVRGWRWHVSRARAYLRTLRRIVAAPSRSTVYLSLSGGNGLYYDLLVVAAARLRADRVVLHHHSFDYVDRDRGVLATMLRIAPRDHVHVLLCHEMGRSIRARYGADLRCVRVSNFCFFPAAGMRAPPRPALRRIGYLSNISRDKGVDRFLDLAARFADDAGIAFDLAGPFADDATRRYVEERLAALPRVTYHGPLFGEAKQAFYRRIDAFMFPSRYSNEAEPLVVYEALSAGLPVVVTSRGCLCEMVDPEGAVILDRDGDDIEPAVRRVALWKDSPADYAQACAASLRFLAQLEQTREPSQAALLAAFDSGFAVASKPVETAAQTA